jgi:hypothetical protein
MAALIALIALAPGADPEPLPLNARVVEYARTRLGETVADGDCTGLAYEALKFAGARTPGRDQPSWGDALKTVSEARPGDVLQFEDAVFVRKRLRDDGALITLTFTLAHHTAVVSAVRKRGPKPVLAILHQNAGVAGGDEADRKVVQEWTLNFAELKGGTVKAYRPAAPPPADPGPTAPARPGRR